MRTVTRKIKAELMGVGSWWLAMFVVVTILRLILPGKIKAAEWLLVLGISLMVAIVWYVFVVKGMDREARTFRRINAQIAHEGFSMAVADEMEERLLALGKKGTDPIYANSYHELLAAYYRDLGDYDKTLSHLRAVSLEQLFANAETLSSGNEIVDYYAQLLDVYRMREDRENYEKTYEIAQSIFAKYRGKNELVDLNIDRAVADFYTTKGNYEEALALLEQMNEKYQSFGADYSFGYHLEKAVLYRLMGKKKEAEELLLLAEQEAKDDESLTELNKAKKTYFGG